MAWFRSTDGRRDSRARAIGLLSSAGLVAWVASPSVARAQIADVPSESQPAPADVPPGAYARSTVLAWTSIGLGVLHHTDHVLRDNHSGFPFTDQVTLLTATLAIYPITLGGLYFDAGPAYWTTVDSALLCALVATHLTLEPPGHVYEPWTDGSNLLDLRSPAMGGLALGVLGSLTLSLGAHLVSSVSDGIRYGFTWKRRKPTTAQTGSTLGLGANGLVTWSQIW